MKRLQTRAAAAALSALLLALPTCALAAETAPLTLSTQQNAAPVERRTDLGQLNAFGRSHTYMGVSVSDEWLYQARIGGLPLGLSLFTPEGDGVTFREYLCAAQTGGKDIRLCLRAGSQQGGLLLQLDQRAADMLERLRITEIVLTDIDYYIQETYLVSDIAAMRQALALSGGEQLCLAGENAPLSVVSEDGVRRIISE